MQLHSPQFSDGEMIPAKFTCDGDNVSPTLILDDLPVNTESLVLIVDDPDSTEKPDFIHWICFNIPPTGKIGKGDRPGKEGVNDFGRRNYDGPCPSSGTHSYRFTVYALDSMLELGEGTRVEKVQNAMMGHIIDSATLVGTYNRMPR